jgi:RHH-type transcriptional regulator, rel operon repressor / antitoxin RelB
MFIYLYRIVLHCDTMATSISLRVPDDIHEMLEEIAENTDRSKSYIILKAIGHYLDEYAEYQIALDRLNNKDDETITRKEMRKRLASRN